MTDPATAAAVIVIFTAYGVGMYLVGYLMGWESNLVARIKKITEERKE